MTTDATQALIEEHGEWGEHPTFPLSDWKYEVENDDTRQGYWSWVASKVEGEAD